MANSRNRPRIVSTMIALLTLAGTNAKRTLTAFTALLFAVTCMAQDQAQPPLASDSQTTARSPAPPNHTIVTIPNGTRFALVLTNPVSSKTMHRGDEIYAQTTAPLAVGDQVVIPAGTFVQGKVEKLARNGSRGEMLLQSAAVIFPDGYVANIAGPLTLESEEGTAWLNPSGGAKAGVVIAPMAGLGLGALIGNAAHTTNSSTLGGTTITSSSPKGLAIGSLVGLAAGAVVAIALLAHSHQFFVDVGSPMEMTLPQPITLAQNQVADAVRQAQEHPVAVPMPAPRPLPIPSAGQTDHGTCYTPDTPGTPPTIIPGTPGVGDSPGTPDTVIPGTPSIPGTPYPCP